jgi:hypothetical protein
MARLRGQLGHESSGTNQATCDKEYRKTPILDKPPSGCCRIGPCCARTLSFRFRRLIAVLCGICKLSRYMILETAEGAQLCVNPQGTS